MSDRKISTTPRILTPFTAIYREVKSIFDIPQAVIGGFFGMIGLSALTAALFMYMPGAAVASEEEEYPEMEFEPGTLVRIGKKMEEKDIPDKIIVEEKRAVADTSEDALTKKEEPKPEKEKEKEKKKPEKKAKKSDDKKTGKESDISTKKNTPYDDLPTVEQLPGDPFGDANGWSNLKKEGDPWATSVMAALNNMKVGSYAAQSKTGTYQFKLVVCKDGSVKKVMPKGSTGSADWDNSIRSELQRLKIPKPPPKYAKLMKKGCVSLKYVFKWRAGTVR